MNRLAAEPSLYLRQHADNPVDWYPWSDEAFERARELDRPVLLSIGYAACHWCHVMAHESFADPEVGRMLNDLFVCIKVDREERPDVDALYLDAVQTLTGRGGWPLTVFLTPDRKPFLGGTYFPAEGREGLPSFTEVLQSAHRAYSADRARISQAADRITGSIAEAASGSGAGPVGAGELDGEVVTRAADTLHTHFEPHFGGFERSPKFPPPMALELVMRAWLRNHDEGLMHVVAHTLDHMMWGGIYDQLGGGFHRYSTDDRWGVPHFEKMLYDNAQLARTYLLGYRFAGRPHYLRCVEETLGYLTREMLLPCGALAASQDADSEGEEGRFYLFSRADIARALTGDDRRFVADIYNVSVTGNVGAGAGTLTLLREPTDEEWTRLSPLRERLLQERGKRVPPARDEKVVAGWNGLAIAAFAEAGATLERGDWLDVARSIATHLVEVQTVDGVLHRSWHEGAGVGHPGFCEDYAAVAWGLLALYEATFEQRWFDAACDLADRMLAEFEDHAGGGFFTTGLQHERLVVRHRDLVDHPLPSGNSMAATVLARLAQHAPESHYRERAVAALAGVADVVDRMPSMLAQAAVAIDHLTAPSHELAIVGDPASDAVQALVRPARREYRPHLVVEAGDAGSDLPLLADREARGGHATAYLCSGMTCLDASTDPTQLERLLGNVH